MHIYALTLFGIFAVIAYPTAAKPRDSVCDECVYYNFERDFTVLFSTTEVCTGLQLWSENSYSAIDVTPPNEYSQGFISPQVQLSCAVSFPFTMRGGGTVYVRVYMDTTDTTLLDQVYVLAEQRTESGINPTMGIGVLSSTSPDFQRGWQTLAFDLFGSTTFDGHLIFFGLNTARSIVLVDAFCYKPANYDGECWVEDFLVTTTAQPETTVTEIDTTTVAVTYPTTVSTVEVTSTETEHTTVTDIESTTSAVTEPTSATGTDSTSAETDHTSVTDIESTTSAVTEPTSATEIDSTTSATTDPTSVTGTESNTSASTEFTLVTEIESTTSAVNEPTTVTEIESTTLNVTEPDTDHTTSVITESTSVTEDGSVTSVATESPSITESTTNATDVTTELPSTTTTTAAPPTLPTPTCPVGECSWLISHEYNCNLFYQCVWGQKILRQCPIGLHFNYELQVCDWPYNAGCIYA